MDELLEIFTPGVVLFLRASQCAAWGAMAGG
jgi:hypothetical protein